MRMMFAAAALFAAAATPALAQTAPAAPATPAAAPAPAEIPVDNICPRSLLAVQPVIPDPATVTNSGINKANLAYTAWTTKLTAFRNCKEKELGDINAEIAKIETGSPAVKMKVDYDTLLDQWEKAVPAYKASGYPTPAMAPVLTAPGAACPPAPDSKVAAPIPTTPVKEAKKKDVKAAQEAFGVWASPRNAFLKCTNAKLATLIPEVNAAIGPLNTKKIGVVADYEQVQTIDRGLAEKWTAFRKAYKARMSGK